MGRDDRAREDEAPLSELRRGVEKRRRIDERAERKARAEVGRPATPQCRIADRGDERKPGVALGEPVETGQDRKAVLLARLAETLVEQGDDAQIGLATRITTRFCPASLPT